MPHIVSSDDHIEQNKKSVSLVGGKALGLHQLKELGIGVPPWATITSEYYCHLTASHEPLSALIREDSADFIEKARTIRAQLQNITLSQEQENLLIEVYRRVSEEGKYPVAVRSSAADEDGKALSFAGQMDSFLNVRTRHAFLDAVKCCWASLFGDRAMMYRKENKIDPWRAQIAVVVQRMIEAEVSGVLFSANPLTGNPDEMLVSSTWGLGEGLVSGQLDADTFVLGKEGVVKDKKIDEKAQKVIYGENGGTRTVDVDDGKKNSVSLSEKQLKELHNLALKVQGGRQAPMDIEFGIERGTIYLLQARPITNLKEYVPPREGLFNVWDNSNIVESYCGVTTPMTFSFIRKAYFAVYWQFCEVIGVDKKTIFQNRYVYENMLGLIQGRVYYNLLNWYRLIALMPGFQYNKGFMEEMMGLHVVKDFHPVREARNSFEKYFIYLPRLLKVGLRMIVVHHSLQKRIEEFFKHFDQIYLKHKNLDYEKMAPAQIMKIYRGLEDEVLWKWKAPILNDFEAMIFYGLLKKLTVNWGVDKEGCLHNDLLCAEGNIKSTAVITELFAIAQRIEADPGLKAEFTGCPPQEALDKLKNNQRFQDVLRIFNQYLDDYGVRCIEEMKLESIPIKDNPVFCAAMIQNYLQHQVRDPNTTGAQEGAIRKKAAQILEQRLSGIKLAVYKWVLKNARKAIRNRENQRFARTEIYSLIRVFIRAIGKNWTEQGLIDQVEDIFYLELDEVWGFIEGTSTLTDLKGLTALRRKEFEEYQAQEPDDHIETYGEVYTCRGSFASHEETEGSDVLKGLGCCQGTIEHKVQVIFKPDTHTSLNGEIMAAKQTDPGWAVLFPSIGGLVVEKGSMLSHSAIVAREMGIPAVVGVKRATQILKTGDRVILDGGKGTVTKVGQ